MLADINSSHIAGFIPFRFPLHIVADSHPVDSQVLEFYIANLMFGIIA